MGRISQRHMLLLVFGTLAGFLGGIMMPYPLGVRGAILGLFLSIEIVLMNCLNSSRLDAGQPPYLLPTMPISLVVGLICGTILDIPLLHYPKVSGEVAMFIPYLPPGLGVYAITVAYCFFIPITYHLRWGLGRKQYAISFFLVLTIFLICLARYGFLAFRIAHGNYNQSENIDAAGILIYSLFGALPFGILWTTALFCCDPAWSFERWKRMKG